LRLIDVRIHGGVNTNKKKALAYKGTGLNRFALHDKVSGTPAFRSGIAG